MKPMYVGLVLMALVCAVGIVSADSSGTTEVDGSVSPLELTLTAPASISPWALARGVNNQNDFTISVSTNDASGVPCTVTVSTDNNGRMYFDGDPVVKSSYLQTDLAIWNLGVLDWQSLSTPRDIWSGSVGTTTQDIPISLRQYVTTTDVTHDYTIQLTFTLSQTP